MYLEFFYYSIFLNSSFTQRDVVGFSGVPLTLGGISFCVDGYLQMSWVEFTEVVEPGLTALSSIRLLCFQHFSNEIFGRMEFDGYAQLS